ADIVEIVSEYTSLQKRGENYLGLCPFHNEKTPSFNVDVGKQLFYCFGCGAGGNAFNFVMKKENINFPEAVRYLADKFNVKLPGNTNKELSREFRERREYFRINRLAAKYYNYCLLHTREGDKAMAYIKNRGLTQDIVEKFFLGYAPSSWDGLIKYAGKRGIKTDTLEKIGLIIPRKDNKGYYDRFRNRIMFPIEDVTKNIIGFGGRALDESMPKYLNSPETPLFSKGDNLYALSMIKRDPTLDVTVVEGYMDCISLHQHGFKQTVASLGTALTKKQATLLKKYTDGVILSYDADEAGRAATVRGMDILAQEGFRVKILSLPDGKDPDEVIKSQGAGHFQKLLTTSMDLISYKLFLAKRDIDIRTPDGKLKFIKQAVDILTDIDNEPELEIHVRKLAAELGISPQAIKKEVQRSKLANNGYGYKKSQIRDNNKEFNKISPVTGFYKAERKFLKLIIENKKIREKFKGQINPRFFTNSNTQKIADVLFEIINKNQDIDISHVFNYLDEEGCAELSTILMEHIELKDEGLINALVKKIKQGYFKKSIAKVREQIRKAEILGHREEINDLLITYQQLKTEMDELNNHAHTTSGKEGA
ncbi:MAG TPA: DNA primase, partial [Thermoanaerobacterales bacterium]|nr:DNA primase [Thermoanaerobacterales bacterium]